MKKSLLFTICLTALALSPTVGAQDIEYLDDQTCGCELLFVDGIHTTSDGTHYGLKRRDGVVIAPNIYSAVDRFHDNYCLVYDDSSRCGMIDRDGNIIVPCLYDALEYPSENRILAVKDGRMGHLDLQGNIVIPISYLSAGSFSEGLAPALIIIDSFSSACTFIDSNGHQVFPPIYQNVMPFYEGYAPVRLYDRWGMIDKQGNEVLTTKYEYLTLNRDGHFFAGDEYGMALFDYSMKPVTPFVYTKTSVYADGRVAVCRNGKFGFLDTRGREVIPCQYDEVNDFFLGRAKVVANGHCGIIDTLGNIILPIEYDDDIPMGGKYIYADSLALVEKDGRMGYIDLDGNIAIPFYFDRAFPFSEGLAVARHQGLWGYIDTHGEVYIPFIFDHASPFSFGIAEVIYYGNVSNIDFRGRCIKNCNGIIAWREIEE